MTRMGQYSGAPFQGLRKVTQGDPFSPTILNRVVDVTLQYLVTLVAGEEAGPDNFGHAVLWLVALSYADGGLLSSL